MSTTISRRGLLTLGAVAGTGALLAACSSNGGLPPAPAASASASGSAGSQPLTAAIYDKIILAGPVADAATVNGSPWAQKVKNQGYLKRGGVETSVIFSLKDPVTGRTMGFDAGIGDLLAHYILGSTDVAKLQQTSLVTSDTRETMLQNNTVDAVIATYSITPARAQKVAFAGPYYSSGTAVQVRRDNTTINSYKDLDGKKVATESNSTGLTALQKFVPTAQVTLFSDNDSCIAALEQGRVEAYVLDQAILLSNAAKNKNLKVVGEPFTVDPYGIGLNKDDPTAKTFVNGFLQKIFDGGNWADLWKATVGQYVEGGVPKTPTIGSADGS